MGLGVLLGENDMRAETRGSGFLSDILTKFFQLLYIASKIMQAPVIVLLIYNLRSGPTQFETRITGRNNSSSLQNVTKTTYGKKIPGCEKREH